MDGPPDLQGHLAIDARAGIPTSSVFRGIDTNGERVRSLQIDEWRRIDAEWRVAVVPFAGKLAIDINFWKCHNPIEVEVHAAVWIAVQRKLQTVPTDTAPGKFSGVAIFGGIKWSGDCPVVRHTDDGPFAVVEACRLSAFLLPFRKSPARMQLAR